MSSPKSLPDSGNRAMMVRNKRRKAVRVVLYCVLFIISLGVVAFGLVMLKIAYDLHHPTEFLAVFFSALQLVKCGASYHRRVVRAKLYRRDVDSEIFLLSFPGQPLSQLAVRRDSSGERNFFHALVLRGLNGLDNERVDDGVLE